MSDQPLPRPGRERVFDALYASLRAREQQGWRTYGRPLESHNGRDALRDALEEALDLAAYLQQAILERDHPRETP